MCVIIHKPAGVYPSDETLYACSANNPDGFGIMFVDDGRVRTIKDVDNAKFFEVYKDLKDRELGIHFRWKTHGKIDHKNTHPYKVLDPKSHGQDLWLMHNGVISMKEIDKNMSDTWHFVELVLRPILAQTGTRVLNDPAFQEVIETYIGSGSKLLLLDQDSRFIKINETAGVELDGCWLSNDYSHTLNHWSGETSQAALRSRSRKSWWLLDWDMPLEGAATSSAEPRNDPLQHSNSSRIVVTEGSNGMTWLADCESQTAEFASRRVEDLYRYAEGANQNVWLPSVEDMSSLHNIEFEDIAHLSFDEMEFFCRIRPDLVASLLWRAVV